jgi:3-hydroxyacyl-[acyl-carrier-protein] dehydratase
VRFLLFDRVTKLEPGRRIEGVKCVSLTEECFRGHFDRRSLFPGSLLVEAMIQLLAWCAMAKHDFKTSLVLSMLDDVQVPTDLEPGHRIDLFGELTGTNPRGSMGRAWAEIDGKRIASVGRVLYAHLPAPDPEVLRERFRLYGGEA